MNWWEYACVATIYADNRETLLRRGFPGFGIKECRAVVLAPGVTFKPYYSFSMRFESSDYDDPLSQEKDAQDWLKKYGKGLETGIDFDILGYAPCCD